MDWNLIGAAIVAWVGQVIKSRKDIPTWATQAVIGLVAFAMYAVGNLPAGLHDVSGWMEWIKAGLGWALGTIGGASVYAATGVAPKTDTTVKGGL